MKSRLRQNKGYAQHLPCTKYCAEEAAETQRIEVTCQGHQAGQRRWRDTNPSLSAFSTKPFQQRELTGKARARDRPHLHWTCLVGGLCLQLCRGHYIFFPHPHSYCTPHPNLVMSNLWIESKLQISSSAENHRWSVPVNQTTELRAKGTERVELLGFVSSTATLPCLCVMLIILGSCTLGWQLQKWNAHACTVCRKSFTHLVSRSPVALTPAIVPTDGMVFTHGHQRMGSHLLPSAFGIQTTGASLQGWGSLLGSRQSRQRGLATLWTPSLQQLPWR